MIEDINILQKLHVYTRRAQRFATLIPSATALTQASSTAANPTQAASTAANPTQAASTWAVTSEGPPTTGDITNGAITAGAITNGAITAGAITNGAITAPLTTLAYEPGAAIPLTKIGTAGLVGLKVSNVTNDVARDFLESPLMVDWTRDTFWRVLWSSDTTTAADTVTWKMLLLLNSLDVIPQAGATALTTPLVADAYGTTTAAQVKYTKWGKLAKNTLPTQSANTYLTVDINATVLTFATGKPHILGYQIAYTPKLFGGKSFDLGLAAPTDA